MYSESFRTNEPRRETRLCRGIYKPTCDFVIAPIEVFCETVVLDGSAYVWIDGVNSVNPLLLPVDALHKFENCGTLREYLEDERHLDLGDSFDDLLELCMGTKQSATVIIRSIEIMHNEGLSANNAVITAQQWGDTMNELDAAERAAYQRVAIEVQERPLAMAMN